MIAPGPYVPIWVWSFRSRNSIDAKDFIVRNEAPEEDVAKLEDKPVEPKKTYVKPTKKPVILSGVPGTDEEALDINSMISTMDFS